MPLRWAASRRIEFDENGERAAGAIAYFWLAGTTTPITVYQDAALTTPHEQNSSGALSGDSKADSIGRWPEVWIPFSATAYRERVVTSSGVELWDTDEITRTDPVEASEDSVDDTQLLQTGDFLFSPKSGTRDGFVRANGRTVGSATSGATERANADTEDLYTFLWNNFADSILAVATGRGASAAADFAANKAIALFDLRGGTPFGLDDMGGSAASRFASSTFTNGNATTGGSIVGANSVTLATGNLPSHTHTLTGLTTGSGGGHTHTATTSSDGSHDHSGATGAGSAHTHSLTGYTNTGSGLTGPVATTNGANAQALTNGNESSHTHTISSGGAHTHTLTTSSDGAHTHSLSGTSDATGSGTAVDKVPRAVLGNWLIKL